MKRLVAILLVLLAVVFLVACQAEETPVPTAISETQPETTEEETATQPPEEVPTEPVVVEPTEVVEEAEPTEEAAPEPTPEPTATPIVVVDVDSACVNCHTDIDQLKALAEEPEEVHLSSGEG